MLFDTRRVTDQMAAERVGKSDGSEAGGGLGDQGPTDSHNSSDSPRELRTTEGRSGGERAASREGERGRQTAEAAATSEAESERCLPRGPIQGFQCAYIHGHVMIREGRYLVFEPT